MRGKVPRKDKKERELMIGRLPGPLKELLIVGLGNAPYPATRHRKVQLLAHVALNDF